MSYTSMPPPGKGDCFPVALEVQKEFPGSVLVHSIAKGPPGSPHEGKHFWHAWVEVTTETDLSPLGLDQIHTSVDCIDRSNDQNIRMPREVYYRIGNIDPDITEYYDQTDAAIFVAISDHAGPWVSDPEGIEVTEREDPVR